LRRGVSTVDEFLDGTEANVLLEEEGHSPGLADLAYLNYVGGFHEFDHVVNVLGTIPRAGKIAFVQSVDPTIGVLVPKAKCGTFRKQ